MDRAIFEYDNGERKVFADPLVLRDRLFTVSMGEFWNLRAKVAKISAANDDATIIMEGIAARGHLVTIARGVFDMVPFDDTTGKGAMADLCLAVTEAFLAFLNQKKTTAGPSQTTLPSTANTPAAAPSTSPSMASAPTN